MMITYREALTNLLRDNSDQDLVEYALVAVWMESETLLPTARLLQGK
jgi:hypothetical protein